MIGLFRKEEKTHFERDESGRVVKVEREGGGRTPISDRLLSQVKTEKKVRKEEYRKAYQEAKHKATLERMKREGKRAGSMSMSDKFNRVANRIETQPYSTKNNYNPFGSLFDSGIKYRPKKASSVKYKVIGGKAYPVAGSSKKKKKRSSRSGSSFGGFNMTDNWGFMK